MDKDNKNSLNNKEDNSKEDNTKENKKLSKIDADNLITNSDLKVKKNRKRKFNETGISDGDEKDHHLQMKPGKNKQDKFYEVVKNPLLEKEIPKENLIKNYKVVESKSKTLDNFLTINSKSKESINNLDNFKLLDSSSKKEEINSDTHFELPSDIDLEFELDKADSNAIVDKRQKISSFYYINSNKLSLEDLKNGRRIFNNKTELSGYSSFDPNFIEFRQLLFSNLLLKEDFSENLSEPWTMESAIFSTFCYEEDFIEPLIQKYKLKSLIIKHQENQTRQTSVIEHNNLITFVHPKIEFTLKWGKFHSKLTIFKFPNFIRIIIPSANLTSGDWYYWGQIIWFQDFPLKTNDNLGTNNKSDFEAYFLKMFDYTMPTNYASKDWYTKLDIDFSKYDFSNTPVDLVASSSGRFTKNDKHEFGLGRLKFLKNLYSQQRTSFKNTPNNKLTVQCSSIGKSLKDKFFSDLCEGFSCREESKVEIIFPSEEYINSFPMGKDLSGCLFLGQDAFLLHRYKFKKLEVLEEKFKTVFHSKFFISSRIDGGIESNNNLRNKNNISTSLKNVSDTQSNNSITPENLSDNTIFYFGSHNLSVAAWGSLEKNDSQISISNFELGIIFNPIKIRFEEKQNILKSLLININSSHYTNKDMAFIAEYF